MYLVKQILVLGLLGILSACGSSSDSATPTSTVSNVIGAVDQVTCEQAADNDSPACYVVVDTVAKMYGVIGSSSLTTFNQLRTQHPDVNEILMVNVPGSEDDETNVQVGRALKAAGLNTRLESNGMIASGGVDYFLAGTQRVVMQGAQIGVHSWADGSSTQGSDLPTTDPQHNLYLDYYRDIGFPNFEQFYFFTLNAAPSSSVHYMTNEEITRFAIATTDTQSGTGITVNGIDFSIVTHTDAGFTATDRKVVVFGVPIYAYADVENTKLNHAAHLMAQYLDNNEDGVADNPTLVSALQTNNAALYLWKTSAQQGTVNAQDLGADETIPAWHTNGHTGRFDAALEEVWHVVTHSGYVAAYPTVFGETTNTTLTNAMDIARGGQFTSIPNPYPTGAWYSYNDATCDYECMATEYIYWAMSSMLGAQENRLSEIQQEWRLNTRALVQSTDANVFNLLTDTQYGFPIVLPDGTYGN